MPLVSFFRSTKRSNKENVPQLKNVPRISEASLYSGPSPYSVITQPKKVKGPRSCPGAPMNDTRIGVREQPFADQYSQLNSSIRYENLPRKRVGSFDGKDSRRLRTHHTRNSLRETRGGYDTHYQYESFESDDDDYGNFINMQSHIADLSREEKKMRDKCRDYKKRLDDTYEEADYYRRNFERQSHAIDKLRKTLDNERKQRAIAEYKNKELTDAYKQANERIMDLEEKLNFFERNVNENSLQEEEAAFGAGEALCEQSDDVCSRDLMNSDTPSVSMFSDGNGDPEKDEVRVFHLQDSDECDVDDEAEVERSLKSTPLDLSAPALKFASTKIGKSLSDTNLQAMTTTTDDIPETLIGSNNWIKTFKGLALEENTVRHHQSPVFSSSEEDGAELAFQQQQYEKQLRKIGDAVKYKPPRKVIEEKYFRRYAKPERSAIESLNFLDDMSSDASGLLSSPDFTSNISRTK